MATPAARRRGREAERSESPNPRPRKRLRKMAAARPPVVPAAEEGEEDSANSSSLELVLETPLHKFPVGESDGDDLPEDMRIRGSASSDHDEDDDEDSDGDDALGDFIVPDSSSGDEDDGEGDEGRALVEEDEEYDRDDEDGPVANKGATQQRVQRTEELDQLMSEVAVYADWDAGYQRRKPGESISAWRQRTKKAKPVANPKPKSSTRVETKTEKATAEQPDGELMESLEISLDLSEIDETGRVIHHRQHKERIDEHDKDAEKKEEEEEVEDEQDRGPPVDFYEPGGSGATAMPAYLPTRYHALHQEWDVFVRERLLERTRQLEQLARTDKKLAARMAHTERIIRAELEDCATNCHRGSYEWRARMGALRLGLLPPSAAASGKDNKPFFHQLVGLAWMRLREVLPYKGVRGGILADEMGLGKTMLVLMDIAMDRVGGYHLSAVAPAAEAQTTVDTHVVSSYIHAPSLVVCPNSLLGTWVTEVTTRFDPRRLDFLVLKEEYTPDWRQRLRPEHLANRDIIFINYDGLRNLYKELHAELLNDIFARPHVYRKYFDQYVGVVDDDEEGYGEDEELVEEHADAMDLQPAAAAAKTIKKKPSSASPDLERKARRLVARDLSVGFKTLWKNPTKWRAAHFLFGTTLRRLVLDEATQFKNDLTLNFRAVRAVHATVRWCVSGTPLENNMDELYSQFVVLGFDRVMYSMRDKKAWHRFMLSTTQEMAKATALQKPSTAFPPLRGAAAESRKQAAEKARLVPPKDVISKLKRRALNTIVMRREIHNLNSIDPLAPYIARTRANKTTSASWDMFVEDRHQAKRNRDVGRHEYLRELTKQRHKIRRQRQEAMARAARTGDSVDPMLLDEDIEAEVQESMAYAQFSVTIPRDDDLPAKEMDEVKERDEYDDVGAAAPEYEDVDDTAIGAPPPPPPPSLESSRSAAQLAFERLAPEAFEFDEGDEGEAAADEMFPDLKRSQRRRRRPGARIVTLTELACAHLPTDQRELITGKGAKSPEGFYWYTKQTAFVSAVHLVDAWMFMAFGVHVPTLSDAIQGVRNWMQTAQVRTPQGEPHYEEIRNAILKSIGQRHPKENPDRIRQQYKVLDGFPIPVPLLFVADMHPLEKEVYNDALKVARTLPLTSGDKSSGGGASSPHVQNVAFRCITQCRLSCADYHTPGNAPAFFKESRGTSWDVDGHEPYRLVPLDMISKTVRDELEEMLAMEKTKHELVGSDDDQHDPTEQLVQTLASEMDQANPKSGKKARKVVSKPGGGSGNVVGSSDTELEIAMPQRLVTKFLMLLRYVEACPPMDKILVFTDLVSFLPEFKEFLGKHGVAAIIIDGKMNVTERDRAINDFNTMPAVKARVLLISLRCGNLGLNLQVANHVVMYGIWFNGAVEEQAKRRSLRPGQKKTVYFVYLVLGDSIEELVIVRGGEKSDMITSVIGGDDGVVKTGSNFSRPDISQAYVMTFDQGVYGPLVPAPQWAAVPHPLAKKPSTPDRPAPTLKVPARWGEATLDDLKRLPIRALGHAFSKLTMESLTSDHGTIDRTKLARALIDRYKSKVASPLVEETS